MSNEQLLAEIFIKPSAQILENRFSDDAEAANCNGKCESGGGCIGSL